MLLRGQNITAIVDEGTVYEDIDTQVDAIYTLMLTLGYLTVESISWGPAGQECNLIIPNKEIRGIYSRDVSSMALLAAEKHYDKSLKTAMVGEKQ